jgi:TonB family protein
MRSIVLALLALLVPSASFAQKTEADLRARLVKKPLYLRGQWGANKLAFDGAGHIEKPVTPVTFTLAGVEVHRVKLTAKELVLEGQRVVLEFKKDVPVRVGLDSEMTIRIQTPADGDFTAALDAIFTDNIADLVPQMPSYWQTFAQGHLLRHESSPSNSDAAGTGQVPGPSAAAKLAKVGGSVTEPRLLTKVDPDFSDAARALKYTGIVLVTLVVDQTGTPRQVRILRPAGLGLDERAVSAVEQYTFQPAMDNGKPVAVQLNVEVNFQIFYRN